MKTVFLFTLAIGCALGAQPTVWANDTCPDAAERDNYIILGEDAPEGKYPYMVSLNFQINKQHMCGGTVLTKNWVLSAGHCCHSGYELYIYAGSNSLSKGGTNHRIEFVKVHEDNKYNDRYWLNDICVIKLKDPLVLGKNIQKVTLPPQNYPVNDGDRVDAVGWGYTKPDERNIPDKLQLGKDFVALSYENCLNETGVTHRGYLCARGGKKGQGICNGDSGGPLMKKGVQVGISSWVYLPCGCGKPDFYARVPIFIDWIKNKLGSEASELQFMK